MSEEKIDVAAALKAAVEQASPQARRLVAAVLEIERANQHLSVPHVKSDIQQAIVEATKADSGS